MLANSRLKAVGMQDGRQTGSGELGVLVSQIRRILSVPVVRAQAGCLHGVLHYRHPVPGPLLRPNGKLDSLKYNQKSGHVARKLYKSGHK